MRAQIDAHFRQGELEVVVARIPGRTQDAVLGMAHLCHPQGFANDNASGAASLLETAVALRRLIDQQVLSPPDRSIYFLWMPEMTGTYAWLQAHEDLIPHIVAGINLDMVGEHQEQTGSVLVLERPPDALPSFAPDLLDYLRHELLLEQPNLSNTDHYARVRYATTAFSGGSDHMITSDPTVGIPTPMLIQWPDRFYHTTADTLDKVDPASLALAGTLAGTYLYWLARAGRDEVAWLGATMTACFEQRLSRDTHRLATRLLEGTPDQTPLPSLEEFVAYRHRRALESLTTLRHLASCDDLLPRWRQALSDTRDRILARALDLTATASHPSPPPPPESSPHLVPIRRYRGPIMDYGTPTFLGLSPEDTDTWQQLYRDIPDWRSLRALAEYWADGQRSLAEIERLVWLESGHNLGGSVETYFHLLESAGLVELRRRPD
ncbi:MAG: DUF4910 domain-containing protein [Caldilineae bacterium]|nr:MAG: DUF4910 domain-containing protein [Caldilineae bacterium]